MLVIKSNITKACKIFVKITKSMNNLCDPGFFEAKTMTIPSEKYKTLIMISTGIFLGCQSKISPNIKGAEKEMTKIFRRPKKRR
jgi:hypothetical protein